MRVNSNSGNTFENCTVIHGEGGIVMAEKNTTNAEVEAVGIILLGIFLLVLGLVGYYNLDSPWRWFTLFGGVVAWPYCVANVILWNKRGRPTNPPWFRWGT